MPINLAEYGEFWVIAPAKGGRIHLPITLQLALLPVDVDCWGAFAIVPPIHDIGHSHGKVVPFTRQQSPLFGPTEHFPPDLHGNGVAGDSARHIVRHVEVKAVGF